MNFNPDVAHIVTEVIKLELEITTAILTGHKASDDDKFAEYRKKLKQLRNILKLDSR